ncbi:MAG: hypothetical protein ACRENM_02605 [Candidatus Dormibacteraceae bacterium]
MNQRDDNVEGNLGRWHGWDSPVGLGLFMVLLGVSADLFRWAVLG